MFKQILLSELKRQYKIVSRKALLYAIGSIVLLIASIAMTLMVIYETYNVLSSDITGIRSIIGFVWGIAAFITFKLSQNIVPINEIYLLDQLHTAITELNDNIEAEISNKPLPTPTSDNTKFLLDEANRIENDVNGKR